MKHCTCTCKINSIFKKLINSSSWIPNFIDFLYIMTEVQCKCLIEIISNSIPFLKIRLYNYSIYMVYIHVRVHMYMCTCTCIYNIHVQMSLVWRCPESRAFFITVFIFLHKHFVKYIIYFTFYSRALIRYKMKT